MNSSSIVKRTLPLIIILVLIIGIAVSCTLISTERDVPSISNKDGVYATYKYGSNNSLSYDVKNDLMYQTLKPQGISSVLDWCDKLILSNEKNADGKDYYSLAEEDTDALLALKDETIYGDEETKAKLTDEEKTTKETDYVKNMTASGFVGVTAACESASDLTADEKAYYAIQNARELYAWDQLAKDIKEKDDEAEATKDEANEDDRKDPYFTNSKIESYYNSNYEDGYWAIVVPFTSSVAVTRALAQLGIEVDSTSSNGWKWTSNGEFLTASEILDAHIKLYNNVYSYKVAGENELVDTNVYNFAAMSDEADGKYSFSATKCEDLKEYFYYTYAELNSLNSSVRNRVAGTSLKLFFENNTPEGTSTNVKGYQTTAYTSNSTYYLILKLAIEDAKPLWDNEDDEVMNAEIKAEIIAELTEEEKTDTLVKTKMVELRKANNLKFYDDDLETLYTSNYDSEMKHVKKSNKTAVCTIEVNGETKELTADELFATLSKRLGMTYLIDIVNKEVVLNSEYNTVVDYKTGMSYKELKKSVKDSKKWNDILESVQALKTNFAGNAFSYYGYPSTYGWDNFIKDFYLNYYGTLITSEQDLMVYNIYQDALSEFAKSLNDYATNTELQNYIQTAMDKTYGEYFNASGYHFLISVYEEDGTTMSSPLADDTAWTTAQVDGAKELYAKVIAMIDATTGDAATVLQDFVTAYNAAPYLSLYGVDGKTYVGISGTQPELENNPYVYTGLSGYVSGLNIEISKYKTLGLSVKYEALSSFGAGKMVTEFETVARYIWETMYKAGEISYDNGTSKWTVDHNQVATTEIVKAATNDAEEYLVTEFGYHVYVQTGAEGYPGETPTKNNTATGEIKNEFKEYRVPTVEEIKTYLEIINSDEYEDITSDSGYTSGDEDTLFEIVDENGDVTGYKLTKYQRACISNYFTTYNDELVGSYAISLKLVKELLANKANFTLGETGFTADQLESVLNTHIDYNIEKLTNLGDFFK